jgi:alpha-L-fucosidase
MWNPGNLKFNLEAHRQISDWKKYLKYLIKKIKTMKNKLLSILFVLAGVIDTFAQQPSEYVYISTFESLQKRATPQWYNDAKLGIFIHWGLYSVPGWATPTTTPDKVTDWKAFYKSNPYAEWYLNSLRINGSPTQLHHEKVYGENFDYYSFRDTLINQTKNWNSEVWADLFSATGARYVVLTSKHHDGFTMYPSRIINPFMEKEKINSPRDYVGELVKAVRNKGMKYGIYYSGGLDWSFNQSPITNLWPDLFESMPKSVAYTAYADCQLHELIQKYKPDILWNDVNYPKNGDLLGIFAELINLNNDAVINDRWGQYPELANFTTPEYQVMDSIVTKKWETCRGLGYSFGYNQVETDVQLLSSEELIHLLIDIVSKNGNLLLNVGPKSDGTIPENQLKRLTDLGEWMKINSEGIHYTHPYVIPSALLKDATEVRFTQKNEDLYIFLLSAPKNKSILIPSCKISQSSNVLLYGTDIEQLSFSTVGDGIEIKLPKNMEFKFAKMIKITGVFSQK